MHIMTRWCFALAASALLIAPVAAQNSGGQGQSQNSGPGARRQTIAQIMAAHPKGGKDLTNAIYALVASNPTEAAAIVEAARSGSPEQQQALGAALGLASVLFASDPVASASIAAAQSTGTPDMQAGYAAGQTAALNQSGGGGVGGGGGGSGGSGFVLIPTTSGGSGSGPQSGQ